MSTLAASQGSDAPHSREGGRQHPHTVLVRNFFDNSAAQREHWIARNRYYYKDIEKFVRSIVPPGKRVLEVGCGLGDLLAALKPSQGVGVDVSPAVVALAQKRHPELTFIESEAETLTVDGQFDYVILAGTLGYLTDIQAVLGRLRNMCTPQTRIIVTFHNYLWEPVLRLGELIRERMPQPPQNWLSPEDVTNLFRVAGYRIVKRGHRLLLPKELPLVSTVANRFLAPLPGLTRLGLTAYLVARLDERSLEDHSQDYSCSVIIPARNERGNIEAAMQRMPRLGRHTEVVFIEGHSSDGTLEEIERVAALYGNEGDIKVYRQEGKGKGDAVRKAMSLANGDILIILDADLTVPPEDLPKFFDVIASGRAEFANGCRLVYPLSREAMPLRNTIANKLFGSMFSYLLNQRLKDTLCGTKALWRRDYEAIAAGRSYFGDFDPFGDFDLLFGASKLSLDIVDVPVRYEERGYGRSNIQHVRAGLVLLRMCAYASKKIKFV